MLLTCVLECEVYCRAKDWGMLKSSYREATPCGHVHPKVLPVLWKGLSAQCTLVQVRVTVGLGVYDEY